MSTVISKNVQIGADGTASNNFTAYQPATPDGTLRIGNGNSGSVTDAITLTSAGNVGIGTSSPTAGSKLHVSGGDIRITDTYPTLYLEGSVGGKVWSFLEESTGDLGIRVDNVQKLTINSSGNLGLGVTPSVWSSNWRALQSLSGGSVSFDTYATTYLTSNAYLDLSWKYYANRPAGQYRIDNNTHLWYTAPGGTAGNAISFTQAMTLTAAGDLLVGNTTNDQWYTSTNEGFTLNTSNFLAIARSGGSVFIANRLSSDGAIVEFKKDGGTVGSIGVDFSDDLFIANGAAGLFFNNTITAVQPYGGGTLSDNAVNLGSTTSRFKDLYLSGGVFVGGTTAPNYLDDYEEGTWTPTVTDAANNATMGVNNSGTYTKIGSVVTCQMYVETTSLGSIGAANALYISGWPFTIAKSGGGFLTGASGLSITAGRVVVLRPWGGTLMRFYIWDATTGTSPIIASQWSASGAAFISVTYTV